MDIDIVGHMGITHADVLGHVGTYLDLRDITRLIGKCGTYQNLLG